MSEDYEYETTTIPVADVKALRSYIRQLLAERATLEAIIAEVWARRATMSEHGRAYHVVIDGDLYEQIAALYATQEHPLCPA